ncbi:hypothetical protein GOBAR_DD09361 [Gossypium barbadense]|nr:hypothetical protein GOBAR_DD09361 [Gossypium barbadense]
MAFAAPKRGGVFMVTPGLCNSIAKDWRVTRIRLARQPDNQTGLEKGKKMTMQDAVKKEWSPVRALYSQPPEKK